MVEIVLAYVDGRPIPSSSKTLTSEASLNRGVGCVKCHAAAGRGTANVGPDLTGLGLKYDKAEIIRSVLDPSDRLATGYQPVVVATAWGSDAQDPRNLFPPDGETDTSRMRFISMAHAPFTTLKLRVRSATAAMRLIMLFSRSTMG